MRKKRKLRAEHFRQLVDLKTQRKISVYTVDGREVPTPSGMPNKVVLHGQHYDIRYHTNIYFARRASEQLTGCVIFDHRLIFIDPGNSLHQMRQTLFHEILHVYMRGANVPHDLEEKLCDLVGWGIYDLLQNNAPLALSCRE